MSAFVALLYSKIIPRNVGIRGIEKTDAAVKQQALHIFLYYKRHSFRSALITGIAIYFFCCLLFDTAKMKVFFHGDFPVHQVNIQYINVYFLIFQLVYHFPVKT